MSAGASWTHSNAQCALDLALRLLHLWAQQQQKEAIVSFAAQLTSAPTGAVSY